MTKQEPEEPNLKELFQQLKQADERHAPSFVGSWAAAQARLEPRDQPERGWRFSMAVIAVVLIAGGFFWGWRTFGTRTTIPNQQAQTVATPKPPAPPPSPLLTREDEAASWPPKPRPRRRVRHQTVENNAAAAEVATRFYALVEDDALAPLESGQVVRVEVPASTLIAFGLSVTAEAMTQPVQADLLYGQDGLARAIRFLPATKTQWIVSK